MEVRLGETTLGQHGSNIYYKEFFVTSKTGVRHYRPGRFYFVQKSKRFEVAIAEFQLIWHNLKDSKNYASVKLYFKPEIFFDNDEDEAYGLDEVVEASRQVVIECSKFATWECTSKNWYQNYGTTLYDRVDVNKLKALLNKDQQKIIPKHEESLRKVKILNFPQYNRYKTCVKMLNLGVPMTYFELLARGGLDIKNLNTLILFSKKQFEKDDVEDFSPTKDIPVPVFKGRPRKRKNIQNPFANNNVVNKKIKIDTNSNTIKVKIDHKANAKIGDAITKKMMEIPVVSPPPVHRVMLNNYLKPTMDHPGRGVRGRDTICHEKRDNAIKDKEEHHRFSEDLHRFMASNGTPILKIPRIGCAPVDPLVLYKAVMARGGYAKVTLHRDWRGVYDCLGHSTMITNAATGTRKLYERMLLPYERYKRSCPGKRIPEKRTHQIILPKFDQNDIIRPRERVEHTMKEKQTLARKSQREPIVIGPKVSHGGVQQNPVVDSAENLSISLMMSKQRGRPSKKFRNQIERLRTRQTMQLEEEQQQTHQMPVFASKNGRFLPRKQPWVNELNVDIASRQHTEVPMSSGPPLRTKDREQRLSSGSDVELISPRRNTEIHSPLRQGRRIYPSTKESAGTSSSSGTNGFVPDAFIPILPNTAKQTPQPHSQKKGQCEFKIQSVRSLAAASGENKASLQQPKASPSNGATQYVHYPYSTNNTHEYIPTKFYSLSDSNKLVPINGVQAGDPAKQANQKATFRDAGFSMRTFRHEQSSENNSYKIKSTALKNHEPYIIHHPSHLNRGYREIPGQYPVIYTHQPGAKYASKNERSAANYVRQDARGVTRYVMSAPVEYGPPPNGTIVYSRVQPRYDKVSPRSSRVGVSSRERPVASSTATYVKYIDPPPPQAVQKWPTGTELLKVKGSVNM